MGLFASSARGRLCGSVGIVQQRQSPKSTSSIYRGGVICARQSCCIASPWPPSTRDRGVAGRRGASSAAKLWPLRARHWVCQICPWVRGKILLLCHFQRKPVLFATVMIKGVILYGVNWTCTVCLGNPLITLSKFGGYRVTWIDSLYSSSSRLGGTRT